MSGVETVLLIIAAGSVITSLIVVMKKGILKCSCCGMSCVQQINPNDNNVDSGRSNEIQEGILNMLDNFRKNVDQQRRKSLENNPVPLAVELSKDVKILSQPSTNSIKRRHSK